MHVSETTHSWRAVVEPLEAVISIQSSGSYNGNPCVNSSRDSWEVVCVASSSIVGTISLQFFKSRLVCIFCTSTINIYTSVRKVVVSSYIVIPQRTCVFYCPLVSMRPSFNTSILLFICLELYCVSRIFV
jgi:hypothetical protein